MCLLLRCLRFPPRLPVCRSCRAVPCHAVTCRAWPRHSMPAAPRLASPGLASPIHTCLPRRAPPSHAGPCLASPAAPCPSMPNHSSPILALPAAPCHAVPRRALPSLPCVTSRVPLSPPRCHRAASGAGSAFSARSAGPAHPPPRLREGLRASPHPPRADTGFRCLRRFGPRTD